jgi:Flp pilus assembly protein CpaB
LTPVPVPLRPLPAYTRITRDHLIDPQTQQISVIYLPPAAVSTVMLTRLGDIVGRVLDHEKAAGFVFTETDFLPRGTREGLVAGIPAGRRALRVDLEKVDGLVGLRLGDRFDLVATLPIDAGQNVSRAFDVGGMYGAQLSLQARLQNWQKQATVQVLVQNGVLVEPVTTRQVPVFSRSLTQGGITRMRPVQEAVIAVAPGEVAQLTEAMAVGATISTVPRSGRPDDPIDSVTPGLRPVSPFAGGVLSPVPAASTAAEPLTGSSVPPPVSPPASGPGTFTTVERISGSQRELTAVPRR